MRARDWVLVGAGLVVIVVVVAVGVSVWSVQTATGLRITDVATFVPDEATCPTCGRPGCVIENVGCWD